MQPDTVILTTYNKKPMASIAWKERCLPARVLNTFPAQFPFLHPGRFCVKSESHMLLGCSALPINLMIQPSAPSPPWL